MKTQCHKINKNTKDKTQCMQMKNNYCILQLNCKMQQKIIPFSVFSMSCLLQNIIYVHIH